MDRRTLRRGARALVPEGLEGAGFLVAFTERCGGSSRGPFASLNLAFHTGDRATAVRRNRATVTGALGIPPFATAAQVHGARQVRVGRARAGAGFHDPAGVLPGADVLATSQRRIPVAVLTADCVPIALASPQQGLLLVVHAGWRGMAEGIVQRALAAFEAPSRVLAALGPAIGPCHYEVSDDVAFAVASGAEADAVVARRGGRPRLDLSATAALVLRAGGVRRMERAEECTACLPQRFYSHRRDGERTGRQALVAARL